jgi:carbonic anhydrase/acetyltransferase-like protein (isoleucine patch superfamily)
MWAHGIHVTVDGKTPFVADGAFVAPNATLVGDVTIEEGASVWFGAVLRGDDAPIRIGRGSNVQENVVIHVGPGNGTVLEEDVTVGHSAILHSCVVRRGAVVGMAACIQERAVVGEGSLVAAGAVVPEGFEVPPGSTAGGVPARIFGPLSERSRSFVELSAGMYHEAAARYRRSATWNAGEATR